MKIILFARFLAFVTAISLSLSAHAQILDPVSFSFTSGTTGDALVGPAPGDNTANLTIDSSAFRLAEQGQDAANLGYGIPDGVFLSKSNTATKIASFEFQPANDNNILKGDGTLTLTDPEGVSNVAFLVQSLSNPTGGAVTFTLNFSDSTSESFTTLAGVPYWTGGDPTASGGTVALSVSAIYQTNRTYNGAALSFDEYDFALTPDNVGKTVDSVTVDANGSALVTYAFSATEVPEPSTWAMFFGGLGLFLLAQRLRQNTRAVLKTP